MTTDFIGKGWSFPVTTGSDGAIATVGGLTNVEKAMRIVLMTRLGERPMRPAFGSRLHQFMFEPVSPEGAAAIGFEVRRALDSCEPRVAIEHVDVQAADDGGPRFDIDITYSLLGSTDQHNLVVPFYAIPGEES